MKSAGDIQGIRLTKDGLTFKGSQISREFSFAKTECHSWAETVRIPEWI